MRFYFTFGSSETQPFYGGWVEVVADGREAAIEKFQARFPNHGDYVNCAFIYSEDEWKHTGMAADGNNLGHGCHEVIE